MQVFGSSGHGGTRSRFIELVLGAASTVNEENEQLLGFVARSIHLNCMDMAFESVDSSDHRLLPTR